MNIPHNGSASGEDNNNNPARGIILAQGRDCVNDEPLVFKGVIT